MAGTGNITFRNGMRKGMLGTTGKAGKVELGYGTPTHAGPNETIFIKLDATMGTSSHYRKASGTWTAMSDA